MGPSEKKNGTVTQGQNGGSGAKSNVGPNDSNGFLKDLSAAAIEYLSQNKKVSLKANDLLHLSFPPNPLRLQKMARFPKIIPKGLPKGIPKGLPKGLPAPVVRIAGGTGLLSVIYHIINKVGVNILDSCYLYGKFLLFALAASIALKVVQNMRHTRMERMEILAEQIPDRVLLIVCDDTLAHHESRAALFEILESPKFFAMIPTCVSERIYLEMESTSRVRSSKAYSAWMVILDLMRHRKATREDADMLENLEDLEMGWYSSDDEREEVLLAHAEEREEVPEYAERIINCAQNEDNRNDSLACIITYSKDIKNRATQRGLRCYTPHAILKWLRN